MGTDNNPAQPCCTWGLYVILDVHQSGLSHLGTARQAIAGGARVIQLRDKAASFEQLLETGRELRELTRAAAVTLIVNDNPYLAQAIDADGVHLGQTDFPAYIARELLGPEAIIGVSTHTKQQAVHALTLPVNYIGVGPIFPTTSKQSEYKPLGIEYVRWVKENVRLPIVAIGGITADKIKAVVQAGADNIAVIREVMGSGAIESKTRELCTIIDRARKESK